jgi:hypothetical protein
VNAPTKRELVEWVLVLFSPLWGLAAFIAFLLLIFLCADMILSIGHFSTKKARGFSEAKFTAVEVGMQSNEVVALLGPPLMQLPKWEPSGAKEWAGLEEWCYTLPNEIVDGMGHWNFRAVMVSNGIVVDIKKHIVMHH